ncbi:hypothetical protein ABZP36_021184 [Zizania latifolia]
MAPMIKSSNVSAAKNTREKPRATSRVVGSWYSGKKEAVVEKQPQPPWHSSLQPGRIQRDRDSLLS